MKRLLYLDLTTLQRDLLPGPFTRAWVDDSGEVRLKVRGTDAVLGWREDKWQLG